MVSDVDQLEGIFLRLIVPLSAAFSLTIITLIILWQYSPMASVGMGTVQAAGLAMLARSAGPAKKKKPNGSMPPRDTLRIRVSDLVRGRRDISVYGGVDQQRQSAMKAVEELDQVQADAEKTEMRNQALISTMSQLMVAITFFFAALSYQQGNMELKHIALFAFVLWPCLSCWSLLPKVLAVGLK